MKTSAPFDFESYKRQEFAFPSISYERFEAIDDLEIRKRIVQKNKILQTDTYNRTMNFLRGEKGRKEEVYTLTFRKAPNGNPYNVVYGVRNTVKGILDLPVTQEELDFASDFYAAQKERGGNSYFDRAMWQEIIDTNDGYIPVTIQAVDDGTILKAGEPVMSIKGPGEFAAVYEPVFLRTFFQSVVATDIHFLEEILGSGRIVEFGKRASVNEKAHIDAVEACYVGGGLKGTSNDVAAAALPRTVSAGTTAHRYLASYSTEDEAFENAIEKTEKIAVLVDLVDSNRGIDKVVALKKKYRDSEKAIYMRLDSGDLLAQAVYAFTQLRKEGMLDPIRDKIIIADISDVSQIRAIETMVHVKCGIDPKDFILYGLGGLLVAKNKLRDAVSAAFKLTQTEDGPTGKLSNDAGKGVIPGELNIEIRDGERWIVQESEEVQ